MSWLTSPPALIIGLLASVIAIGQALRGLVPKVILFPRWRAERQLGRWFMLMMTAGERSQAPEERDYSRYQA
jgi:hypothetical protein